MFDGSPLLTEEMKKVVLAVAPKANFIRSKEPPVIGAVILGMQATGWFQPDSIRKKMIETTPQFKKPLWS